MELTTNKLKRIDFNKLTNIFFIGFAFSIPISKALVSIFMALMILSWLAEGKFLDKLNIIKHDKLSLTFMFLIGFSFLSLLWSPDILYALDFIIRKYWHYLTIPIILTSLKLEYIKYILNAFLTSMFISEIMSYGIFFEIWTYKNILPTDPSPFINHIDYSIFLAFALMIILTKLFKKNEIKWKIFYLFYFLTGISNLFINGGRTGQIAFLISIFIMVLIYFKTSFRIILSSVIGIALTLTLAYNFSPNFKNRISQLEVDIINISNNNFSGSVGQRVSLWIIGSKIFIDNPLLGKGIGGEMEDTNAYSELLNINYTKKSDYHNTFVQYAVQLGILGLLVPIFVFYILLTLKFKTKEYKLLTVSFSLLFFMHSMGGFSFHIMNPLVLLCTFAALFNAISYQESLGLNIPEEQ